MTARRGNRAYRAQDVVLVHRSPCRTVGKLLRHHFGRGRGYGRILRDRDGIARRDLFGPIGLRLLGRQTVGRLIMTTRNVRRWADAVTAAKYLRALPLVVLGALAWTAGSWYELLRFPTRGAIDAPRLADPTTG